MCASRRVQFYYYVMLGYNNPIVIKGLLGNKCV